MVDEAKSPLGQKEGKNSDAHYLVGGIKGLRLQGPERDQSVPQVELYGSHKYLVKKQALGYPFAHPNERYKYCKGLHPPMVLDAVEVAQE